MALFRKFFYRKPPDGLLEISERVYVFDCCFTTDVLEEDEYKVYIEGIVSQLREHSPDASFMVFNFREGDRESQLSGILSEYDMTVMDYPRHYEGCPLLTMQMIHHFLRSSESWLSLDQQNVLLMHCERGGWPVLAFMLAGLLIYRKQYTGEQKTLDMIYKQAPRELLHLLSPLNPLPSQLRYLQYISRRNVGAMWPPHDRALTLDCIIIRILPNFDGEGGCRPIFRIYGPDPYIASDDRTPKVLFSTQKKSKSVRLYRQADCELVKIDIRCHVQGDVVLECISLDEDLDREEMMFRVMFNTAFIRSNILMLNRDEIDILWDAKDRFPKDFRAEVLLSDMDTSASLVTEELTSIEEKEGLPVEAFARVQDLFHNIDWGDGKEDALHVLQQLTSANLFQEKLESVSPQKGEIDFLFSPDLFKEKLTLDEANEIIRKISPSDTKQQSVLVRKRFSDSDIETENIRHQDLQGSLPHLSQLKILPQRMPKSWSNPVSSVNSLQGSPVPISRFHSAPSALGITALLQDHASLVNSEIARSVTISPSAPSFAATSGLFEPATKIVSPPVPLDEPKFITSPHQLPHSPSPLTAITAGSTLETQTPSPSPSTLYLTMTVPIKRPPSPPPPPPPPPRILAIQQKIFAIPASPSPLPTVTPARSAVTVSPSSMTQIKSPVPTPLAVPSSASQMLAPPSPTRPTMSVSSKQQPLITPERTKSPIRAPLPPPPEQSLPLSRLSLSSSTQETTTSKLSKSQLTFVPPPPPPPPPPSSRGATASDASPRSDTIAHVSSGHLHSSGVKLNAYVVLPPLASPSTACPPPPYVKQSSAPPSPCSSLRSGSTSSTSSPPPPPPPSSNHSGVSGSTSSAPPPPPPPPSSSRHSGVSSSEKLPNIPPPLLAKQSSAPPPLAKQSSAPPPPLLSLRSGSTSSVPPPPPPPSSHHSGGSGPTSSAPPPPPPPPPSSRHPGNSSSQKPSNIPPAPPLLSHSSVKGPSADSSQPLTFGSKCENVPPPPPNGMAGTTSGSLGVKGRSLSRTSSRQSAQPSSKKASLKPLHWVKVTRAMQGSLWAETQKSDEASKAPEFDISELESLFSAAVPNSSRGSADKLNGLSLRLQKPDKVHLIDLRRANNCEIMLTKVKMPLPDLLSSVLALDDSVLDGDQVDNLIKFCPTKEEMDLLKGFGGDKENLGKCEQYFLELMKVPRIESKLRVFSFKIQFRSQVADLRSNLNIVNSSASEIKSSVKLKRIMQTILSLGNALNQGTARGSAIGFRLDSLLKLTDTRARNNKMTLMHYLCKVLADKLPELLDFPKDLVSLEAASKIQLKFLAEEMQAISKGLEKVEQELTASESDGPISETFRKTLKGFLVGAEAEVRTLTSLYSNVGRNADALALYFGEDPARCPFEQVISTLSNFVRMFINAHNENCKQLELEKKKAQKEAENEKMKLNAHRRESDSLIHSPRKSPRTK